MGVTFEASSWAVAFTWLATLNLAVIVAVLLYGLVYKESIRRRKELVLFKVRHEPQGWRFWRHVEASNE